MLLGNERRRPWRTVDWDADRDWEWHTAADDSRRGCVALFDESVAAADAVLDEALADGGLDRLSAARAAHAGEAASACAGSCCT